MANSAIKRDIDIHRPLRLVTRRSRLALTQSQFVIDALQKLYPSLQIILDPIESEGDRILDQALQKIGGKGLFTQALEDCLFSGAADFAVHSLKDMPAKLPSGLCMPAVLEREDPRDALVLSRFPSFTALPKGACVGSSSLRRQAQLLSLRPDVEIRFLRGNVDTRLKKLQGGEYDAIVLAMAGLNRLGFSKPEADSTILPWPIEAMLPAVGQGALVVECRDEDEPVKRLLSQLRDPITEACVRAERAMNAALGGSCQTPIGGHAFLSSDNTLTLMGLVASEDGQHILRVTKKGTLIEPEGLGKQVAEALMEQGACDLLKS